MNLLIIINDICYDYKYVHDKYIRNKYKSKSKYKYMIVCCICFEEFNVADTNLSITKCGHFFHNLCISKYSHKCSICNENDPLNYLEKDISIELPHYYTNGCTDENNHLIKFETKNKIRKGYMVYETHNAHLIMFDKNISLRNYAKQHSIYDAKYFIFASSGNIYCINLLKCNYFFGNLEKIITDLDTSHSEQDDMLNKNSKDYYNNLSYKKIQNIEEEYGLLRYNWLKVSKINDVFKIYSTHNTHSTHST